MKYPLILAVLVSAVLMAGCGKKEAAVDAAPPPPDTAQQPPADPNAGQAPAEAQPQPAQPPVDYSASMAQAEQQVQKRDFESATRTLIQVQYLTPQASDQASINNANKMRQMQIQLAEELARNPKNTNAKNAANMLQLIHTSQRPAPPQ